MSSDSEVEDAASSDVTFADLGLEQVLVDACTAMKFTKPTPIQRESIPKALEGNKDHKNTVWLNCC